MIYPFYAASLAIVNDGFTEKPDLYLELLPKDMWKHASPSEKPVT